MNKLQDILRLVLTTSLSDREIGRAQGAAKNTVRRYRILCREQGRSWDALSHLAPADLDATFNKVDRRLARRRIPDFAIVHAEMQKPNVTLQLLWEEYREADPDNALSYSQYTPPLSPLSEDPQRHHASDPRTW